MSKQKMTAAELRRALTVVSGNTPVVVDTDDFMDMDVVEVDFVDGSLVLTAAPPEEEDDDYGYEDVADDDHEEEEEDDCVGCHCGNQPCSYTGFEEPTGFAAPATGFAPHTGAGQSFESWWRETIRLLWVTRR